MSNINPNNINGAYPVAGVDNDSQGFRDNFTNIKNNFAYAQSELNDLQSKVVLKSALSGTTLNNNMAGTLFSGAEVRDLRETRFDNGVIASNVTLDHATGHYQAVQTNGTVTIAFANLPAAGKIGRIRLKLIVTSSTHRLVLPAAVTLGTQYVQEYRPSDNSIGFTQSGPGTYYFEFLTDDAGTTISIQDLTRNQIASDYTYANIYANGTVVSPNVQAVTTKLIIDSTQTWISNVNITFPTSPIDGQFVSISSYAQISNLYLIPNSGATISGNVTTLNGNSHLGYTYVASSNDITVNKWLRTQV
jgi:hypothetical protein